MSDGSPWLVQSSPQEIPEANAEHPRPSRFSPTETKVHLSKPEPGKDSPWPVQGSAQGVATPEVHTGGQQPEACRQQSAGDLNRLDNSAAAPWQASPGPSFSTGQKGRGLQGNMVHQQQQHAAHAASAAPANAAQHLMNRPHARGKGVQMQPGAMSMQYGYEQFSPGGSGQWNTGAFSETITLYRIALHAAQSSQP